MFKYLVMITSLHCLPLRSSSPIDVFSFPFDSRLLPPVKRMKTLSARRLSIILFYVSTVVEGFRIPQCSYFAASSIREGLVKEFENDKLELERELHVPMVVPGQTGRRIKATTITGITKAVPRECYVNGFFFNGCWSKDGCTIDAKITLSFNDFVIHGELSGVSTGGQTEEIDFHVPLVATVKAKIRLKMKGSRCIPTTWTIDEAFGKKGIKSHCVSKLDRIEFIGNKAFVMHKRQLDTEKTKTLQGYLKQAKVGTRFELQLRNDIFLCAIDAAGALCPDSPTKCTRPALRRAISSASSIGSRFVSGSSESDDMHLSREDLFADVMAEDGATGGGLANASEAAIRAATQAGYGIRVDSDETGTPASLSDAVHRAFDQAADEDGDVFHDALEYPFDEDGVRDTNDDNGEVFYDAVDCGYSAGSLL